jgi:PAS domain S-box-containing protein
MSPGSKPSGLSLLQVIANMLEGVVVTDPQGAIQTVNAAFSRITGYSPEEVIGKNPRILKSGRHSKVFYKKMWDSILSSGSWQGEICNRRKNGEIYTEWMTISSVRNDRGEITHFVSVFTDITKRKELERQLTEARDAAIESAQLKSEFMANMSHEIRTPMNAIIGMSDLVAYSSLSAEQKKYMDVIKKAGNQLLTLINDILDFSKLEAAQFRLEPRDFDLKEEIDMVINMLSGQARIKGLKFEVSVAPDVPPVVQGDPHRLRQILTNLIGNSVKFTERGVIGLEVKRESTAGDLMMLRFRVRDSGIGILPEQVGKLFQAFSQLDVSSTRRHGGTGLGLAISKRLVELMGGDIGVESVPGKGTTFWFTVQFGKAHMVSHPDASVEQAQSPSSSPPVRPGPSAPRVLVVEDTEFSQMVAMEQLRKLGIKADLAFNGIKALEALKKSSYDLVLMDCMMPEMDGYQASEEIRRREKDSRHIPIVAMTANALKDDLGKCLAFGMNDYIAKPVTLSGLQAVLERNLPSWRPEPLVSSPVSRNPDTAVFDEGRLREITGGDEKKMRELEQVFFKTTSERLRELATAVKKRKPGEVQSIAHSSASGAGSFGAGGLFFLLKRLEDMGVQGELEKAESLLQDVQKEFKRLKRRVTDGNDSLGGR